MDKKELTISNIWGQIPIKHIVQDDCKRCTFAQIAILGGKECAVSKEPYYKLGVDFCLKLLQDRHPKANLAHLILILRNCGAPKDPSGGAEWKDYSGSMKKLEKAFESELPNLEGASLEGAYLYGAKLVGANLEGAYLEGASLNGADLERVKLVGANLSWANLECADLQDANLYRAKLTGADLERANLSRSNLYGASLARARLVDANLKGANLKVANLEGANLEYADLEGARYNSNTKFPAGFETKDKLMIKSKI